MSSISLRSISKTYPDGKQAVRDVSLEIEDGAFVVLVGPSGCGKSTTLRMIAGLESITSGVLEIDGRRMNDVRPKDRDIAMVFQNYALYPHLSVEDNMGFALRMRGTPRKDRAQRVRRAAELLGIDDILGKKPGQLSGGQRQRVALGRAIVREPKAFLFDEPLSNLDPDRRVATRAEIRRIQRELRTTTIYVTHDHEEAMALGDLIVVMKDGDVLQSGSPTEVYERPSSAFVGTFLGSPTMNTFRAVYRERDGGAVVELDGLGARVAIDPSARRAPMGDGDPCVLGVRPQQMKPDREGPIRGVVVDLETLGFATDCAVRAGDQEIRVRIEGVHEHRIGEEIRLGIEPGGCHLFA
jgi:ABC-type sugar transport system ATPase subunit